MNIPPKPVSRFSKLELMQGIARGAFDGILNGQTFNKHKPLFCINKLNRDLKLGKEKTCSKARGKRRSS